MQVAERPQELQLRIATFRDRLQPGQRETWRVTIHRADGPPADAELLATLYDQSLDLFQPPRCRSLMGDESYQSAQLAWQDWVGSSDARSVPYAS